MAGKEAGETAFRNALETADRRLKTAETLCGELSVKTAGESESKLAGKEEELAGVKRELAGVREELAGKEAELAGMREKLAGNETELAGSETMVSLDDSFWRERAETAEAQNSVYLGQLEELKEKLAGIRGWRELAFRLGGRNGRRRGESPAPAASFPRGDGVVASGGSGGVGGGDESGGECVIDER